jgi:hypothetical protein
MASLHARITALEAKPAAPDHTEAIADLAGRVSVLESLYREPEQSNG